MGRAETGSRFTATGCVSFVIDIYGGRKGFCGEFDSSTYLVPGPVICDHLVRPPISVIYITAGIASP
jgi:hypothetical protein